MNAVARLLLFLSCILTGCSMRPASSCFWQKRAEATLNSLYAYFKTDHPVLLRETYPFDERYKATYLASGPDIELSHDYAYLWPFSATFSAVNSLLEHTGESVYEELMRERVFPGLNAYYDKNRLPAAYASYITSAPESDRFYDDNIWIGIDFVDFYSMKKDPDALQQARDIWSFLESGRDDKLGGGIYWCEQRKKSKNACSNAPASVLALKLYQATGEAEFLNRGKALYEWTYTHLRDTADQLYFDNLSVEGKLDKRKYAYNSGQMIQAGVLLYQLTGEERYLAESRGTADAALDYFFGDCPEEGPSCRVFTNQDPWFYAVMMRGFIALQEIEPQREYMDAYACALNHAWENARTPEGLFDSSLKKPAKEHKNQVIVQAAMTEMFARMATLSRNSDGRYNKLYNQ